MTTTRSMTSGRATSSVWLRSAPPNIQRSSRAIRFLRVGRFRCLSCAMMAQGMPKPSLRKWVLAFLRNDRNGEASYFVSSKPAAPSSDRSSLSQVVVPYLM